MPNRIHAGKHDVQPPGLQAPLHGATAEAQRLELMQPHHAILLGGTLAHDQVTWQILGSVTGPKICQFAHLGL